MKVVHRPAGRRPVLRRSKWKNLNTGWTTGWRSHIYVIVITHRSASAAIKTTRGKFSMCKDLFKGERFKVIDRVWMENRRVAPTPEVKVVELFKKMMKLQATDVCSVSASLWRYVIIIVCVYLKSELFIRWSAAGARLFQPWLFVFIWYNNHHVCVCKYCNSLWVCVCVCVRCLCELLAAKWTTVSGSEPGLFPLEGKSTS